MPIAEAPALPTHRDTPGTARIRAQHLALARLVPVLYTVVIIATIALSLAFSRTAPSWMITWLPLAMLVVVILRMRYWIRARTLSSGLSAQTIRRDLRGTLILGPGLSMIFSLVGIGLLLYGDPYQQSLAGISIWVIAVACAFCLAALPAAAVAVVVCAALPLSLSFLMSGNELMKTLAGVVGLVSLQVIYILVQNYQAFLEMVASRQALHERSQAAELAEEYATNLAYTDHLTRLSNRRHFEHLLHRRVSNPDLRTQTFAVGILDLDGFKPINDMYGHGVGDDLLLMVAERLSVAAADRAHVARIGGDEFAVLLDGASTEMEVMAFADRIQGSLAMPYMLERDRVVQITSSVGFAFYTPSCTDAARLIDQADMALYWSKSTTRGAASIFAAEHESKALEQAQIEQGLRRVIADNALDVHFQPILDLSTGRLTGFEALARWHDPALGQVSPAIFIPIAERVGLIGPLTDQLLAKAARAASAWPEHLKLSFNLSSEQIVKDSAGLRIVSILAENNLPPARFEAEVTETALMTDLKAARRTIEFLRAVGISIALDDFGTGYSSLSQIRNLPLDKIKIDKSFIDEICDDARMASLVGNIIKMCGSLDLRCVAEGIETTEQRDALIAAGCHAGQGYLFARPGPVEAVTAMIHAETQQVAA